MKRWNSVYLWDELEQSAIYDDPSIYVTEGSRITDWRSSYVTEGKETGDIYFAIFLETFNLAKDSSLSSSINYMMSLGCEILLLFFTLATEL